MKPQNKFYYNLLLVFTFTIAFTCPKLSYAQNTENEQVKRVQRAIYVFNFAQQIGWPNQDKLHVFKIGVLGEDRTVIDLKALASKRKINGKKVLVKNFKSVKDIKNIQLLYVNKAMSYDIDYILNKIEGKNILLVSEDYNFNRSMINIVGVGNAYEYEINKALLKKENFVVANSLKKYSVNSSVKWKNLFKTTEEALKATKASEALKQKELNEKNIALQEKNSTIDEQQKKISAKQDSIDAIIALAAKRQEEITFLASKENLQKQKLAKKIALERELEQVIASQVNILKSQDSQITKSEKRLKAQSNSIALQVKEINDKELILKDKELILKTKDKIISFERKLKYLLGFIVFFTILGGLIIFKSYIAKRKLAEQLEEKNKSILAQTKELELKNNELEQFAYIASHDLKEPLITISSLIDLLVEDYNDQFDEEGQMNLRYIQDSSDRMKTLIDSILTYSRLGKSKDHGTINCNTLIDILKNDLQYVITNTKSTIKTHKLPTIKGSELELRLLFQNLISNGIKFTKPNVLPIINISAKKTKHENKDYWQFEVKDNGIGISKKYQERIFSIFQRLHTREEYEGTGIGLAHCKKIVEAYGGKIWLTSIENEGSSFYFTIPA